MPLADLLVTPSTLVVTWVLPAGPGSVWSHLTDPGRLVEWLGRARVCELRPGGRVVVDHGDGYLCSSAVTAVEVGSHLAMTWQFPDEPETALDLRLQAEGDGDGCRMVLEHRGLGELSSSYAPDWLTHLTFLEASVEGHPLPGSQFWSLFTTLSQLRAGFAV